MGKKSTTFSLSVCERNTRRLMAGLPHVPSNAERASVAARQKLEKRAEDRRLRDEARRDGLDVQTPDEAWNRANFGMVNRKKDQ
jgi:hypothetical protein